MSHSTLGDNSGSSAFTSLLNLVNSIPVPPQNKPYSCNKVKYPRSLGIEACIIFNRLCSLDIKLRISTSVSVTLDRLRLLCAVVDTVSVRRDAATVRRFRVADDTSDHIMPRSSWGKVRKV